MGTCGKSQMAHEILAYLADHPKAQDTLEGIIEWWLLEQDITRRMANVKEALAELVAQGLVLERTGRDSRTHYRINRRKLREVQPHLKQRSG
jgi:hypothetical protein